MCVQKLSLLMANPRTFTKVILPLLIQSRKRNYCVDKITAVFGFQYNVCFSFYLVLECVIKKIMDLTVHMALRAPLNSTTTLSY